MDPATIAALIAKIIGAINAFKSASATAQWQATVEEQLATIIVQNGQILADLQALSLQIPVDLEVEYDNEIANDGKAYAEQFNVYMSGATPDITDITTLKGEAENLALNLGTQGPCVYQAAGAATTLVLAIHKVLNTDPVQTQTFINTMLQSMTTWAGNDPQMFGYVINQTTTTLNQQQATLANEPRGQQVVIFTSQPIEVDNPGSAARPDIGAAPVQLPPIFITLKVSASIVIDDNALTFTVNNVQAPSEFGASLPQSTITGAVSSCQQRIQAEINAIKATQASLSTLQSYETALQNMISTLQNYHPSIMPAGT